MQFAEPCRLWLFVNFYGIILLMTSSNRSHLRLLSPEVAPLQSIHTDTIEQMSENLYLATLRTGREAAEQGLVTGYDFAHSEIAVRKQQEVFRGEERCRAMFRALVHWLAVQDTGDTEFANQILDNYIPYETSTHMRWDRYLSQPQITFDGIGMRELYPDIRAGRIAIPNFGAQSLAVLGHAIQAPREPDSAA